MHLEEIKRQISNRFPGGVNLTHAGLMQLVERVYRKGYESAMDAQMKTVEPEHDYGIFNEFLRKMRPH